MRRIRCSTTASRRGCCSRFRAHGRRLIEEAAGLRCPALLIHGSNDEATSPGASAAFARRAGIAVRTGRLVGVRATALRDEHEARFRARLLAWLDRNRVL